MAINWVLPVRAVQFVLSVVVLGLMAYGTSFPLFLFPPPYIHLTSLSQYHHGGQHTGANPPPVK
jgi:hypothetical protein